MTKPYIHPQALCESTQVGDGTRVWAFSHVMAGAVLGKDCNVGEQVFLESGAVVGNECTLKNGVSIWDRVTLEDRVFLGPNVVFTNDRRPRAFLKRGTEGFLPTRVRTGASLGANCTVVCGVTIGEYAFVGAGTVVTKDVPPHGLVAGNPGKLIGRVCYCGGRLDRKDFCAPCERALVDNSVERVIARLTG